MLVKNSLGNVDLSGIFSVSGNIMNGKMSEKAGECFKSLMDTFSGASQQENVSFVKNENYKADEVVNADTKIYEDNGADKGCVNTEEKESEKVDNSEKTKAEESSGKVETKRETPEPETENIAQLSKDYDLDMMEILGSLFARVIQTLTESLGISEEELKTAMDELGIQFGDLSQFENINNLFSFIKCDNDFSKLLTDNGLLNELNELNEKISDIFTEIAAEMPEDADFEDIKNSILEKLGLSDENVLKVNDSEKQNKSDAVTDEKEINVVSDKETEKEITIEFKKESGAGTHTHSETHTEKKAGEKSSDDTKNIFLGNMIKVHNSFSTKLEGLITPVHNLQEIASQILEKIKINLKPEMKILEMQLTPENLGKVKVALTENNGVLTARFTTENDVAREAIESNLINFKENLLEQGIKVENVEVAVGNFSFGTNDDGSQKEAYDGNNGGKRFVINDDSVISEKSDDLIDQSYFEDGISTVSYRA